MREIEPVVAEHRRGISLVGTADHGDERAARRHQFVGIDQLHRDLVKVALSSLGRLSLRGLLSQVHAAPVWPDDLSEVVRKEKPLSQFVQRLEVDSQDSAVAMDSKQTVTQ